MIHGSYCGPIAELCGKTALLKNAKVEGFVYAQFDDRGLQVRATYHEIAPPGEKISVGYGWHLFPASHFDLI